MFIDECRTATVTTPLAVSASPVTIYINEPLDAFGFTMLQIASPVSTGASNTNCQISYSVTYDNTARTVFSEATVDTTGGSGEIDFLIATKMQ